MSQHRPGWRRRAVRKWCVWGGGGRWYFLVIACQSEMKQQPPFHCRGIGCLNYWFNVNETSLAGYLKTNTHTHARHGRWANVLKGLKHAAPESYIAPSICFIWGWGLTSPSSSESFVCPPIPSCRLTARFPFPGQSEPGLETKSVCKMYSTHWPGFHRRMRQIHLPLW